MRRRAIRGVVALGLVAALGGCGSTFAEGPPTTPEQRDLIRIPDLAGGFTTRIDLRSGFARGLRAAGVRVAADGDADLGTDLLTLPITSGDIVIRPQGEEPPRLDGRVDHDGSGLVLSGDGHRLVLEDVQLDLPSGVAIAKVVRDGRTVAGSMPLLVLDLTTTDPVRVSPDSPGVAIDGTKVRLRPEGRDLVRGLFGAGAARAMARLGDAKVTVNRAGPA